MLASAQGLKVKSGNPGPFLDAPSHLYKRSCPSVGPSVRSSVGPSVPCYFRRWKVRILGASCAVYPALFILFWPHFTWIESFILTAFFGRTVDLIMFCICIVLIVYWLFPASLSLIDIVIFLGMSFGKMMSFWVVLFFWAICATLS